MDHTIGSQHPAYTLRRAAPMPPEQVAALRTAPSGAERDLAAVRLYALADPAFVAYVGTAPGQDGADPNAARYLAERYAWAKMLIDIVSDLGREQYLPPALWEAWDAALARVDRSGDSDAPSDEREWRVAVVQLLTLLADTPDLGQGVAAALRTTILAHDPQVRAGS